MRNKTADGQSTLCSQIRKVEATRCARRVKKCLGLLAFHWFLPAASASGLGRARQSLPRVLSDVATAMCDVKVS
jgi:hypothetical protein